MNRDLLIKYLEGHACNSEKEAIFSWIESSEENLRTFSILKTEHVFDTFPNTLAESCKIYDGDHSAKKVQKRYSLVKKTVAAAAIILLPFLGIGIYTLLSERKTERHIDGLTAIIPEQHDTMLEYVVNPGVKGVIYLPDGSKVILNSGSILRSPAQFNDKVRNIEISGEAYFDVVGNSEWPMYIKSNKDVSVLVKGTSFNISTYDNDPHFSFTLISGSAELLKERTGEVIAVTPFEEVRIMNNYDNILLTKPNISLNTGWKDGYLLFDNTPIETVIRKMERWYGVSISVDDKSILDYGFTASFESESITRVLEILMITSEIKYKIDGNKVILSKK